MYYLPSPPPSLPTSTPQDGTFSVSGRLATPAAPAAVYSALTNYDDHARVFHNVNNCSVRYTDAGAMHLIQSCNWQFLFFKGAFVTELAVDADPEARRLAFSLVKSSNMRKFVGIWEVSPGVGGGSEVRHSLEVQPSLAPPRQIGELTANIFQSQVKAILGDLDRELRRRG